MKALLIDHDDSFTFNLRSWLSPLFENIKVINHRDLLKQVSDTYDLIIISPGPKSPADYPQTLQHLKSLPKDQHVLGICLGLQIMALSENISVRPYSPPKHGKKSKLKIVNSKTTSKYENLDSLQIARYHSLACDLEKQNSFDLIAISSDDQKPMWLEHKNKKWLGWQFHPESFLTEKPELLLEQVKNWCRS